VQKVKEDLAERTPVKVEELPTAEKPKGKVKGKAKQKAKAEAQTDKAIFPAKGTVNAYGFIHLSNGVAEAFGAKKDVKTPITIDLKDGNLIISKA